MEKKKILTLGVFLMVLVVLGGIGYSIFQNMNGNDTDDNVTEEPSSSVIDEEWLNLEYDYIGDNLWRYQVTGILPNPCYEISTSAVIMESFPEQVVITSTIREPHPDMICIQIVQEVFEEGEFEANEEAIVEFNTSQIFWDGPG